jgi:hypothetical protein
MDRGGTRTSYLLGMVQRDGCGAVPLVSVSRNRVSRLDTTDNHTKTQRNFLPGTTTLYRSAYNNDHCRVTVLSFLHLSPFT